ncbi:MAG: hypothetical protein HRT45_17060 [Bdellovibrionales bacterium]|nr:hypothetical protein [Bdellovibrionales bacterium]
MKNTGFVSSTLIFLSLTLGACASKPELPDGDLGVAKKKSSSAEQLIDEQTMRDLRSSTRWEKAVQRRIASRVRQVRQNCKVYSEPTLMSSNVATIQEGRDIWTQETDTTWFKVYQNKSYGYASKICF